MSLQHDMKGRRSPDVRMGDAISFAIFYEPPVEENAASGWNAARALNYAGRVMPDRRIRRNWLRTLRHPSRRRTPVMNHVRLGLRENLRQFSLLVIVNAF